MKRINFTLLIIIACCISGCAVSTNNTKQQNINSLVGTTDTDMPTTLADKQYIKCNLDDVPLTLDPQYTYESNENYVANNLFEGLVREKNGEIVPGIAKKWDISSDGLTYTFYLRESFWSDGSPLTAKDFEYSWKRLSDPNNECYLSYFLSSANILNASSVLDGTKSPEELGITAIDDYTLEVKLSSPTEYFIKIIASPTLMPVKADAVSQDFNWSINPNLSVSNGPFKLVSFDDSNTIKCIKNPYYWNADEVIISNVDFMFNIDSLTAFNNNEINLDHCVDQKFIDDILNEDDTHIFETPSTMYFAYNMNNPALQDIRVRKALSLAIDRQNIVDNISKTDELVAYGYMPNAISDSRGNSFNDTVCQYGISPNGNIKEAQQLLADAGYPKGHGFPTLELYINNEGTNFLIANSIKYYLEKNLDINIEIKSDTWDVFLDNILNNNFNGLTRMQWCADYEDPIAMLEIFESANSTNVGRYNSQSFDKEIEFARTKVGMERDKHLFKAHDILMADYPIMPISYQTHIVRAKNNLVDWDITSCELLWLGDARILKH